MNKQIALRIGVPVVVIGFLAVLASRHHRLSSSMSQGEAAQEKVAVRTVKPADGPERPVPAPPQAASIEAKRPASGSARTTHSLTHAAVLPYGNGPGQIGRISNRDVRGGPESFWVDKYGRMYVCDTVNGKIKVFSPSGALLDEKELGFPATDMVVADNGDMFVLDMARRVVEQFGSDGRKKASLVLSDALADNAARLRVDSNEVVLQTNQQTEVTLTQEGKTDLLSKVSDTSARAGLKGLNGKRFQTLRNDLRQGEITILNDAGIVMRKLTLPVDGQVASIVYLGQDQSDNSYFQVETSAVNGVELSVYGLDSGGNVVSVIPRMPNDYSSWTAKLLDLDSAGNIYQMLPAEEGVRVNMWQRQR